MLIKYLVLEGDAQHLLNSHKMERLYQKMQSILNSSDELSLYINRSCEIVAETVGDLSDSENAKTATITEKLKAAASITK